MQFKIQTTFNNHLILIKLKIMSQITVNRETKEALSGTLLNDKNGNNYIKIPIENYTRLGLFSNNIIDAIEYVADVHIDNNQDDKLSFTIKALCHILRQTTTDYEYEGLDKIHGIDNY